ncbi:hypothetical protein EAG_04831 [Camponotus floridanus]|uniref:Uncharacterized protein n=1 Tax=Camponotus floridanus TaxID=104421 RepID=E2AGV6_CAMFO|nr:hypothetical protein EAG_04831 [Camponotus floridanus]
MYRNKNAPAVKIPKPSIFIGRRLRRVNYKRRPVYFGTEAVDPGGWCFPRRISILRPPSALPVPGAEEKMKRRDRWQDGEKERVNETDDGRETRKERAACVVFFLFFIPVSDGRGRTNDSDSRAKSYSFGPSTTWPRHNRVKVASRLSPRGGFRSAHDMNCVNRGLHYTSHSLLQTGNSYKSPEESPHTEHSRLRGKKDFAGLRKSHPLYIRSISLPHDVADHMSSLTALVAIRAVTRRYCATLTMPELTFMRIYEKIRLGDRSTFKVTAAYHANIRNWLPTPRTFNWFQPFRLRMYKYDRTSHRTINAESVCPGLSIDTTPVACIQVKLDDFCMNCDVSIFAFGKQIESRSATVTQVRRSRRETFPAGYSVVSLRACDVCILPVLLFSDHTLETFPIFISYLTNMETPSIYMLQNHELILFEYFETVGRNVLDSEQRNRLPDSRKRQVTSLARISNLLVACRVKYSSSKTEAFPYLVFQGIDDTGRITDTRRHTYDPITFRMQITPSNHELEQRYPAISPSSILFDPSYETRITRIPMNNDSLMFITYHKFRDNIDYILSQRDAIRNHDWKKRGEIYLHGGTNVASYQYIGPLEFHLQSKGAPGVCLGNPNDSKCEIEKNKDRHMINANLQRLRKENHQITSDPLLCNHL